MAVSVTPLQTQIYMMSALSLLFIGQNQLAVTRAAQTILLALMLDKYLVSMRKQGIAVYALLFRSSMTKFCLSTLVSGTVSDLSILGRFRDY